MINAAIVGLGWWGQNHVIATKDSDKIRFTRAVDLAPDNVRGFCDEHGLTLTSNMDDALSDPDIDAIVLVTPHTQHADQVVAGAKASKHVLTEKPFALKKADGERAAKAMVDAGLTLGIGHNYRYGAAIWKIKELIDSGELGEIHHIEGNLSHQGQLGVQGWRRSDEEAPTGGIIHFGAHVIDILQWYGGPMREVYAQLESRIITNDVGSVLVKFENGCTGYLADLMTTPATFHLHVMGSKGWARANQWMDTNKVVTCFGAGKPEESGGHTEELELPYRNIYEQVRINDENFAAACMGQENYLFTPQEMAHTAAIHEAIAKSAASGQPTKV